MSVIDPLDMLDVDAHLTDDEHVVRNDVRDFVRERVLEEIETWYASGIFPRHLVRDLGELGVLGMHLNGLRLRGTQCDQLRLSLPRARGR